MRVPIHIALLGAPLAAWIVWWGLMMFGQSQTDRHITDANGLTWSIDNTELMVVVNESAQGETQIFLIKIFDNTRQVLYDKELTIDWDMGGGGFLKAMQADDDPEPEIVYANRGAGKNFYLDISTGILEQKNFKESSEEAQNLADNWLKYHAHIPWVIGSWFLLTVAYYIIYFPVYWFVRWLTGR